MGRFREMADQHPDLDAGDLIFVVEEEERADIKRKGADLFIERNISLAEALCGFEFLFTHLDGRKLLIKSAPGEIIKPMEQGVNPFVESTTTNVASSHDKVKAVKGEGMPTFKDPFVYGNLFILFTIKFPDKLTPQNRKQIRKLLPPPSNAPPLSMGRERVESHVMTDVDPLQSYNCNRENMTVGGEAHDDDDDEADDGVSGHLAGG